MSPPLVFDDERGVAKLNERNAKRKQPDQSYMEYINQKLAPIWDGIRAGAGQGSRAYGPLKEGIDTTFDYLASRKIGPNFTKEGFEIAEPMEAVKARREQLAKDNPNAAEAGYKIHGLLRDRMVPVARAADWLSNMRYGSGLGAASQGLDEYDAAVNRNEPFNPMEAAERVGAAGVGGAGGAALMAGAARRVPGIGNDMKSVPGGPLNSEQLTAFANAAQKAHRAGDPMPDVAQLMRLSQDVRLGKRAPAVEAMYRKAEPVVIDKGQLAQHDVRNPAGEVTGNRLEGRLTTPFKDGRAEVAPPVLEQLRARNEPGSFNATGDKLADKVATADLTLDRVFRQMPRVGNKVNDIIPPTMPPAKDLPQRITTAKRDIYEGDVERARTAPMAPGIVSAPRTRAQGEAAAGSPNSLGMWNKTLAALSPADARIAEEALASIGRAGRSTDPARTGTGPAGIGNAWKERNKAQAALDEHGQVQRSIGESFPYKPGEPPSLTITPPFAAKGFKAGLNIPSWGRGAASAGTEKSFRDPTAAAAQIGMKTPTEQWLAFLGSEAGSALAVRALSGLAHQEGNESRFWP
jgi:hypothetical protein